MANTINSRKDALTNLYNQLLQELVGYEFNLKGMQEQQKITMTINPQISAIINETKQAIAKTKAGLAIAYDMLQEEENGGAKSGRSNN